MSPSMSVYHHNRTKWPPITRPINSRWWRKLVDKTFIPPHYCGTFTRASFVNSAADVQPFTTAFIQTECCSKGSAWCKLKQRWGQMAAKYITMRCISHLHSSSLHFRFIQQIYSVLNVNSWLGLFIYPAITHILVDEPYKYYFPNTEEQSAGWLSWESMVAADPWYD